MLKQVLSVVVCAELTLTSCCVSTEAFIVVYGASLHKMN